jgi:FlaA1/EpsC-like NDP-sugar epimerase
MKKLFGTPRTTPRWAVFMVDFLVNAMSFSLSYFIVKQFQFSEILRGHFFYYTVEYCLVSMVVFYFMRIHSGIIRYSNMNDMVRIFTAVMISGLIYPFVVEASIARQFHIRSLNIPGILIVNFFINSSLLIIYRTSLKGLHHYLKRMAAVEEENILIYGADNQAILIKHAIESNLENKFKIVGFVEANIGLVNYNIQQTKVYHINDLSSIKYKKDVAKMIIMDDRLSNGDMKLVIEKCLKYGIKVLTVPPTGQWVADRINVKQIKELKIENLLQRDPIAINKQNICNEICGKRILITGAAGSIGSEIVRQIIGYNPDMVILCDQAETELHELQLEIQDANPEINIKVFIGSVRDEIRMEVPFRKYRPHIVYHAAAYKHVPMMEEHPSEAILTNVMGTKVVADLSVFFNVQKFVMISSDKAVNPSNVMGTSKRIAEMYVQTLSKIVHNKPTEAILKIYKSWSRQFIQNARRSKTKFITTRFGNVLDSNGSVIPRFRAQIEAGGPVTVTHSEVTRFFMTIPEAVQLVLEASAMGQGAEIFMFDMGEPVRILDLANKMIMLAGFEPNVDINVVFTGLRPGEKLYEELLTTSEKTISTHHDKIKIARVATCCEKAIMDIEDLINISRHGNDFVLVRKMKELVPEFKSNNSKYEDLDTISNMEVNLSSLVV